MNAIARILDPDHIRLGIEIADKDDLFEKIGLIVEHGDGLAHDFVARRLSRREQAGSTGLGDGVAIPHARVKGLLRAQAIYVRPKQPIPFGSPDGTPVTDILALLVPAPARTEHLEILAEAAQMFSDHRFRKHLHACNDPGAVGRQFDAWTGSAAQ